MLHCNFGKYYGPQACPVPTDEGPVVVCPDSNFHNVAMYFISAHFTRYYFRFPGYSPPFLALKKNVLSMRCCHSHVSAVYYQFEFYYHTSIYVHVYVCMHRYVLNVKNIFKYFKATTPRNMLKCNCGQYV